MESLFGLPSHPLLVHAPVVIVPVVALITLALTGRAEWRQRYGLAWAVLAVVSFAATMLANQSGEALNAVLEDRIGDLAADHEELGNQTTLLVFLFMLAVLAAVGVDRRRPESQVGRILAILASALAVAATVWMVRTGHEGARIVWDGIL